MKINQPDEVQYGVVGVLLGWIEKTCNCFCRMSAWESLAGQIQGARSGRSFHRRITPRLPGEISSPHRNLSRSFICDSCTCYTVISTSPIILSTPCSCSTLQHRQHLLPPDINTTVAVIHEQQRPATLPLKAREVSLTSGTRHCRFLSSSFAVLVMKIWLTL